MKFGVIGKNLCPPWISGDGSIARGLIQLTSQKIMDPSIHIITSTNQNNMQSSLETEDVILKSIKSYNNLKLDSLNLARQFTKYNETEMLDFCFLLGVNLPFFMLGLSKQGKRETQTKLMRYYYMPHPEKSNIKEKFLKKAYSTDHLSAIVVTTKNSQSYFENQMGLWKTVHYLPPIIDTNQYCPIKKCTSDNLKLGYIGPLNEKRFPLDVIYAMKSIVKQDSNVTLEIITRNHLSENNWIQTINKFIEKEGLKRNINLKVKDLDETGKREAYNNADLFLFPFQEHSGVADPPITLLEVMSAGKPIISTNVHSIPEIIQDKENGFLITSERISNGLEEKIIGLDKNQLLKVGERARETIIDHFSIERAATYFGKILKEH